MEKRSKGRDLRIEIVQYVLENFEHLTHLSEMEYTNPLKHAQYMMQIQNHGTHVELLAFSELKNKSVVSFKKDSQIPIHRFRLRARPDLTGPNCSLEEVTSEATLKSSRLKK